MIRNLTILIAVLISATAFSQSPQKINFQAILTNSSGTIVANQNTGIKISILQGSANGSAVYAESQTAKTNAAGLICIEIGSGSVISGNFSGIDWSSGLFFVKTEIDPAGGTNYSISGTSQLSTVGYVLYTKSADKIISLNNEITRATTSENNLQSQIISLQKIQTDFENQLKTYIK